MLPGGKIGFICQFSEFDSRLRDLGYGMNCTACGEFHGMLFLGNAGAMYCKICKRGKRRCKQCSRIFSNPKEDGIFKRTSDGDSWHCWGCVLDNPVSFAEEDWIKNLKNDTEELVLQICTVTFAEIS